MKKLFPLILAVLVCSCSATLPPKKVPQKAPLNAASEIEKAKASIAKGDPNKAIARLKRIKKQFPDSDVSDDASMLIGNIFFSYQKFSEALKYYNEITQSEFESPLEGEAQIKSIQCYFKMGQLQNVAPLIDPERAWPPLSPEQLRELEEIRYETYLALGKSKDALRSLVHLTEDNKNPSESEKLKSAAQDLLDSKLTREDLEEISRDRQFGFIRIPAKYRLALFFAEDKNFSEALDLLDDVVRAVNGTELAERAQTIIQQIEARNRVDPKTIGVVLPLTGKQSAIGYKALRGIQLGLGVYGRTPSSFRLAVVDSEGNPDAARRAVDRLVTEDNVIAIIGGLMSKTVAAEASRAQEYGVPSIMLSQKSGVTKAGSSIFRNALTSQMQVKYLVDLAMNKMGKKRFAILYPNDPYGSEYSNLFWQEVRDNGGTIVGAQSYAPDETDFRGHVQRLVGLYYPDDRAEEYNLRLEAWKEKNPKRTMRQSLPTPDELLPPIVDFDAIFIPDSARAVGQIAPMLAYNSVNNVTLIGTNLWNSNNLIHRGQKFVEGALFADSYLANDPVFKQSDFFINYKSTFDEEPGLTEMQAYDSALILRQLIASGETSRVRLQNSMVNLKNFPGALGVLNITEDREVIRPLTALSIKNGQIVSFEGLRR